MLKKIFITGGIALAAYVLKYNSNCYSRFCYGFYCSVKLNWIKLNRMRFISCGKDWRGGGAVPKRCEGMECCVRNPG